jgi:hypothetical protein
MPAVLAAKGQPMLSHNDATRDYISTTARSALPGAPVVATKEPVARPRRALAAMLLTLADRVSPEPVERSRWQSG